MFNFSIEIENGLQYVRIFIDGERNYDECIKAISSALNSTKTIQPVFMVIDESETCFSVSEIFSLILDVLNIVNQADSGLHIENQNFKIAYCNENPEAHDMMQFAETVSVNRGLNLKVFTVASDAINWLDSDQ